MTRFERPGRRPAYWGRSFPAFYRRRPPPLIPRGQPRGRWRGWIPPLSYRSQPPKWRSYRRRRGRKHHPASSRPRRPPSLSNPKPEKLEFDPLLVQDKEPLYSLIAEYHDGCPIMQEKIKMLNERYTAYRRVKGDGNCFYRSFMFSYLEHILETQDITEVARIDAKTDECKRTRERLGAAEFYFSLCALLFISMLQKMIEEESISHVELLKICRTVWFSDNFVKFLRCITSLEIRRHPEFFHPFLTYDTVLSLDQYCINFVEKMDEECEHGHITALSNALGVPIRVVYVDSTMLDGKPWLNHYDFTPLLAASDAGTSIAEPSGCSTTNYNTAKNSSSKEKKDSLPACSPPESHSAQNSECDTSNAGTSNPSYPQENPEPFVILLYRPGHYDILYPN